MATVGDEDGDGGGEDDDVDPQGCLEEPVENDCVRFSYQKHQLDPVWPDGGQTEGHPHGGLDQEHQQQQHPLGEAQVGTHFVF